MTDQPPSTDAAGAGDSEPTTAFPAPIGAGIGDPATDVSRFAPAPDPRPDSRWAWAAPGTPPAADAWTSGQSGSGGLPPYGSGAWGAPSGFAASGTKVTWAAEPPRTGRRGVGLGGIVVASLLSAVLASGGTVIALDRAGVFDRPAATVNQGLGAPTGGGRPAIVDESSAVINVAAKLSPAVVKITVDGQTADPFGNGTTPTEGIGSGVIYDPSGWILTNRHVVTGSTKLTVELKDGRTFPGTVYGIDTLTDLAIVKVDAKGLPTAPIGQSDGLKVGQLVIAIGSPLGTYSFSVTSGIVSGKQREVQVSNGSTGSTRITNLIQTDAAINPGNSGGPLADATGNVIGINTAIASGSSGIGFAIPIDIARPIMNQALQGVALSRPWIGIRFNPIDLQLQADLKLPVSAGALVTTNANGDSPVVPGSPADKAGVKENDIVTALDGIAIDAEHPLDALLTQFAPGATIHMSILRDGKTLTLDITLGTRPPNL